MFERRRSTLSVATDDCEDELSDVTSDGPPYGGSATTDLCRSFKLGLVPTLLHLGGGA